MGRGTDDTTELQRRALSTVAVDSQLQEPETYKVGIEPRLGITASGMGGWEDLSPALFFWENGLTRQTGFSEVMNICQVS